MQQRHEPQKICRSSYLFNICTFLGEKTPKVPPSSRIATPISANKASLWWTGKNKRKIWRKMLNTHIFYTEVEENCGTAVMSSEENEWSNTFDICRNRWLNNGGGCVRAHLCSRVWWQERQEEDRMGSEEVRQTGGESQADGTEDIKTDWAAVTLSNQLDQLKEGCMWI